VRTVVAGLGCPCVIVQYAGDAQQLAASIEGAKTLDSFGDVWRPGHLEFIELPFSHPLYIVFSSGTTGVPKCIIHSAGGTLLQHLKEHRFHSDIRKDDRVFYFTTCVWMMWNWLVSALASRATLILYDGSPLHPDPLVLWNYAEVEQVSFFGTSAKYLDTLRKAKVEPAKIFPLATLRLIASTGSPLSPENFKYVYRDIKPDVQLSSMSGGTDIVSCFVLGDPTRPIWSGEIAGPGLGMAVDVWDEAGRSIRGQKGELVCTKPFPSMPLGFWNDPGKRKFKAAYFEKFGTIWNQGDLAEWTAHDGMVLHGRSDATLNPGGVRIGTAEIYNQIDQLDEVLEGVCVGQEFDGDVRVILFLLLRAGAELDADLQRKVRMKIRDGTSPRHVPAKIVQVSDIPRTRSGKVAELAVREVIHGRAIKNVEALANPEALSEYINLVDLAG
jgi:acetoacetyl-CoA synthetase